VASAGSVRTTSPARQAACGDSDSPLREFGALIAKERPVDLLGNELDVSTADATFLEVLSPTRDDGCDDADFGARPRRLEPKLSALGECVR
jgi:hypothetical protein